MRVYEAAEAEGFELSEANTKNLVDLMAQAMKWGIDFSDEMFDSVRQEAKEVANGTKPSPVDSDADGLKGHVTQVRHL